MNASELSLKTLTAAHSLNNAFCDFSNGFFNTGFLSIFKKRNYAEDVDYLDMLGTKTKDLLDLVETVNDPDAEGYEEIPKLSQPDIKVFAALEIYLRKLYEGIYKLREIAHNLDRKSRGEYYSMSDYNNAVSQLERLENERIDAGQMLNNAMRKR